MMRRRDALGNGIMCDDCGRWSPYLVRRPGPAVHKMAAWAGWMTVRHIKGATEDDIVHVPAEGAQLPPAGVDALAEIDWVRRHRHMRIHTCLHLLTAVVAAPVTGGQIAEDKGRLDFDTQDEIDKEQVSSAVNALIAANHPIRSQWISDEELDRQPELVRTMSVQPPRGAGRIRLLEIPGVDLQPCGGTHVAATGEIGPVAVTRVESKGRRNKRVYVAFAGSSGSA